MGAEMGMGMVKIRSRAQMEMCATEASKARSTETQSAKTQSAETSSHYTGEKGPPKQGQSEGAPKRGNGAVARSRHRPEHIPPGGLRGSIVS